MLTFYGTILYSMQPYTCFLINLEKDTARLRFMDEQLCRIGIKYTVLPAVLGKNLSPLQKQKYCEENTGLNDGEIGCALSHKKIQQTIVSENIPYTLVLEDDVLLPDNLKEIIEKQIKKNVLNTWDYLSFDYYAYGYSFLGLWFPGVAQIYKNKKNALSKIFFIMSCFCKLFAILAVCSIEEIQKTFFKNNPVSPMRSISFTGAFLLTNTGAKKLLAVGDKIQYLADALPNIARKKIGLQFKIYTPLMVRQMKETFTSNIA